MKAAVKVFLHSCMEFAEAIFVIGSLRGFHYGVSLSNLPA